jgi:predicted transcriptional regulator
MSTRFITFVREQVYDLNFDEWYSQREETFENKEQAVKKWNMMCDTYVATQYRVEDDESLEWDDFAAELEEIEDEIDEELKKQEEKKKEEVEKLMDKVKELMFDEKKGMDYTLALMKFIEKYEMEKGIEYL